MFTKSKKKKIIQKYLDAKSYTIYKAVLDLLIIAGAKGIHSSEIDSLTKSGAIHIIYILRKQGYQIRSSNMHKRRGIKGCTYSLLLF